MSRKAKISVELESPEQLRAALAETAAWSKEQQKSMIWDKLTRLPFKLLDKVTPAFIHEKIGQILDQLGDYIQNGGNYLVAGRKVGSMLEELSLAAGGNGQGPYSLAVMDRAAQELAVSSAKAATAQGATTGFGGLFTLAADIPAVLGLSLKAIQEIGLCYGYDPTSREERIFTVKVMQFTSADVVGKQAVLEELSLYGDGGGNLSQGAAISKLEGWREVITLYRDNWGWKKLFQAIPVAGLFFGAYTNRKMLEDVSEAARMLYRKRRALARLAEMEGDRSAPL